MSDAGLTSVGIVIDDAAARAASPSHWLWISDDGGNKARLVSKIAQ